ncbi:ATP-binding protein [Terasakiispira papahanaumokuakeensis]|nr:ATP-binding protein [Terasakiispira papahanaumokuakeensis]
MTKQAQQHIRSRWPLSLLIAWVCIVLIAMTLVAAFTLFNQQLVTSLEQAQSRRVENLALSVAQRPDVVQALNHQPSGSVRSDPALQAAIEALRQQAGMDFIVLMTPASQRLTHPDPDKIGHHFQGDDEAAALAGSVYTSRAAGTLGVSLRGFAPVKDQAQNIIGAVSVGVTMNRLTPLWDRHRTQLVLTLMLIGVVGAIVAMWFARTVKRQLLNMEPQDIAYLVQQRQAMLDAIQEGVLAVDAEGRLTMLNPAGRQLLSRLSRPLPEPGEWLFQRFPEFKRPRLQSEAGAQARDDGAFAYQTVTLDGVTLLVSYQSVLWHDETLGALFTFRDKDAVHLLAEELTGVHRYAEALRASTHEFKNKLHVIQGLLHLQDYATLNDYLQSVQDARLAPSEMLATQLHEPVLIGFLLGKQSEARERGVQFDLQVESQIPASSSPRAVHDLVTVVGNIIENAFEALLDQPSPHLVMTLAREDDALWLQCQDNGPGIDPDLLPHVLAKGVSAKGEGRGLGLSMVKARLDDVGGDISVYSTPGQGTLIEIMYPYWSEYDANEH